MGYNSPPNTSVLDLNMSYACSRSLTKCSHCSCNCRLDPCISSEGIYCKTTRRLEETIKMMRKGKDGSITLFTARTPNQNWKNYAKIKINKHQLVSLLSEKMGENHPPLKQPLYSGKLVNVPATIAAISKLTIVPLRALLHHHSFPISGNKDQLDSTKVQTLGAISESINETRHSLHRS